MPDLRFNSEGAVDGATLDTGQARPDAFDVKTVQANASLEYRGIDVLFGLMGWRSVSPAGFAGSSRGRIGWTATAMGTNDVGYWRCYVKQNDTGQPNAVLDVWQTTDILTTKLVDVSYSGAGRSIRLRDGANTVLDQTTTNFWDGDSWTRVELQYDRVTGAAELRLYTGANLHTANPTDVLTGTATTGSAIGSCGFGKNSDETAHRTSFDECAFSPVNWIGPATLPAWFVTAGSRL